MEKNIKIEKNIFSWFKGDVPLRNPYEINNINEINVNKDYIFPYNQLNKYFCFFNKKQAINKTNEKIDINKR
jgi:hypothetical protein